MTATGKFFETDNRNQGGVFQHCNELIAQRRDNAFKRLGHNNVTHGLRPSHTQAAASFHLTLVDGLDTCTENFCDVCAGVNGASRDSCEERIYAATDNTGQCKINQEDLYQKRSTTNKVYIYICKIAQSFNIAQTSNANHATNQKAEAYT